MIGIAAVGSAGVILGMMLNRWRCGGLHTHDGQINSQVLRDGMPLRFTIVPVHAPISSYGTWTGWIIRNDGAALSLSAEWEGDFPGQLPPAFPRTDDSLAVTVTGKQAVYRFKGQILDLREDTERPNKCLLVIALPTTVTSLQRRRSARQSLTVPATLILAENHADALPQHATIREMSAGGLQADVGKAISVSEATRLMETYQAGTLLHIRLPLPLIPGEGILARVRSCERTAQRGGLGVRIACEFLPMPDFDADLLITHLFRTQGKAFGS